MSETGLPEQEMGRVAVVRQPNGMVVIITGDTGMEGTWIDGLELSSNVLRESLASARELGVDDEVIAQTMAQIALRL